MLWIRQHAFQSGRIMIIIISKFINLCWIKIIINSTSLRRDFHDRLTNKGVEANSGRSGKTVLGEPWREVNQLFRIAVELAAWWRWRHFLVDRLRRRACPVASTSGEAGSIVGRRRGAANVDGQSVISRRRRRRRWTTSALSLIHIWRCRRRG